MAYHCCMDMKLGGWSHLWMPKWNLNLIRATIVIWTWNLVWMETSLDAYNSEGQFKVTCGHLRTRSYSLSLLYGHETWCIFKFPAILWDHVAYQCFQ